MKLVDGSIRRPVTVTIFAIAAIVFGIVAFRQLATDLLPDITYPSLTIRTELEGAAPVEIETLLTRPIENAVGVVDGLVRVSSSSRTGTSEVTLEFAWDTVMDFAALDVRERMDVVRLPLAATPPVLLRYDPSLDPIVRIGVTAEEGADLIRLRRVAEERIKRPLERLDGVAAVVVQGGLEEELQVEVDERQLANLGLSIDLVAQRLGQENVNLTGGRLRDGTTEYLVRTVGELLTPDDLRSVVVSAQGGALVRVEDLAVVRRGFREREIITRINGRESVEVSIFKAGGTNTVTVAGRVREGLEAVREQLAKVDPSLELTIASDQARYIEQSVREVLETALIGGLLAVVVLFLFLRSWKTTLIIAAAIPVSVVATFFLMFVGGISLNIMSLGGLTLGIGLLVDNAIVVLEAIQRRRDRGADDRTAAREGAGEVASAIIASTLTSICVFLPIVFVEGVAAQFFADQALTVTFSLTISLVVALTLIPMLASRGRFQPAKQGDASQGEASQGEASQGEAGAGDAELDGMELKDAPPGRLARFLERPAVAVVHAIRTVVGWILRPIGWLVALPATAFQALLEQVRGVYGGLLDAALRRPIVTVGLALILFGASLPIFPRLGQELIPELIQGEFFVDAELEPGTHLDVTQRRLAALERSAQALPGVGTVFAIAGSAGQQGGVAGENRENIGRVTVTLEAPFSRQREAEVMAALRDEVSAATADGELQARFGRPSFFSFKTPVEVEIRGYNLKLLERLAANAAGRMRALPGLRDVESSTEGGSPELVVTFDRDRLAQYDLSLQEAAEILQTKVQGRVATEIQRDDLTIDIRLRSAERYRSSARAIRNLTILERGQTAIPLSAVAEVVEDIGPAEIRRADGERVAVITANLEGRDLASASTAITEIFDTMEMPVGFSWRMGGQRQEMETSFESMKLAIGLAIFLVYLVMASQFESLVQPLVILFSVPLSLIGVLVTLYLFDVRISVVVLIGVVMLAGIVVNNAIILIDTTNRQRREKGLSRDDALRKAGRVRLRPILMTTATTILGLLPMAIGLGEGSELRTPMAIAVIGGLISSTLLTLVVIPAVYRLVAWRD